MELVVAGVSHQTAPLQVREKLDFSKYPKDEYRKCLGHQKAISSGIVLSTCNRVELYATGPDESELKESVQNFFFDFHRLTKKELDPFLYVKTNREAVRHLFRVASSLESMVVGEPQILGQVKEAYLESYENSCMDPFLDRLLQRTFSVAKKVRTETKIAAEAVSISYAAVELAEKIFQNLSETRCMIVGAGEMAELCAKHFRAKGVSSLWFANRSFSRSFELVQTYGGMAIEFESFFKYLPEVDVVIVSTAAPDYIVTPSQIDWALKERKQEPMFLIDISVPRNVDPAIHEQANVYLYNIDDLSQMVEHNLDVRQKEAMKAEEIIEMEVERFFQKTEEWRMSPLIQRLQEKYNLFRTQEMLRLTRRLNHLSQEEVSEIEKMTQSLVRKVLNDPILYITKELSKPETEPKAKTFVDIFQLEEKE